MVCEWDSAQHPIPTISSRCGHIPVTRGCHHAMVTTAQTTTDGLEGFILRTLYASIDVLADYRSVSADSMDPEAVHRFRVALRRLRSDLRSLRPFLDRARAQDLRRRLSVFDELVRPVRDGDVLMERLSAAASRTANPVDPEIVESLHQYLSDRTDLARTRMFAGLASGSQDELIGELVDLRHSGIVVADADLVTALRERNAQLWRRVHEAADALDRDPGDVELHHLRILVKRSRYLAEASVPAFGKFASRRARRAARIQSVLGDHQDSVLLSKVLVAMPRPTSAHTLVIDALLAAESDARQHLRGRWRKIWRRTARRDPLA